tara:strand:+ start:2118 stop:2501 length:384 start_codon:yes stop_codon:yes gene_type:complete
VPYMEDKGFNPESPANEDDLHREVLAVKNASQEKIRVKTGYPHPNGMANGDITLRYISGQGMFLFVKFLNRLFNTRLAEEGRTGIQKIVDSTGGVITDTVNDTTASQSEKDDVATLASKINEIIGKL